MELYERLEELDADKAEARASRILHGLGFTPAMQRKSLKDFSGGWRMRVALARWVLFRRAPPPFPGTPGRPSSPSFPFP